VLKKQLGDIIMKRAYYQLKIPDKGYEIRKAIAKIHSKTGLDEAVIVEKLLRDAITRISEIFIKS
jgi:hypothetical protein